MTREKGWHHPTVRAGSCPGSKIHPNHLLAPAMSRTYVIRAVHPKPARASHVHIVASVRAPCPTCSRPPCL
eukprot:1406660-Prymnesium_polylepis.1